MRGGSALGGINWDSLYQVLDGVTPLEGDCGRLCGKKCCSLRGEGGLGVYLFPGEEKVFGPEGPWFRVVGSPGEVGHFTGPRPFLLDCRGKCPRDRRPLACRLFPLAPRLDREGSLELILDPDALFICPLVKLDDPGALEPAFREGVRRVWLDLLEDRAVRENVRAYSDRVDRQAAEPWRMLLR